MPLDHAGMTRAGASVADSVPQRRRYIAERVACLLPAETAVRYMFGGQCFHPWIWIGPLNPVYAPFMRWRVVAVADDAIYVFAARFWLDWRPTRLLRVLPRNTTLGPVHGFWSSIRLGPERVWVNWRFYEDLRAADAEIVGLPAAAPESFVDVGPPNPAQPLLGTEVRWGRMPRKGIWYATHVEGAAWNLHVDASNQGTRYIVDQGGKAVAEFAVAPPNWEFDPAPPGNQSA